MIHLIVVITSSDFIFFSVCIYRVRGESIRGRNLNHIIQIDCYFKCGYRWWIRSYLFQVSYAFNSLTTKWFVYWFPRLILFRRSPCLSFPFGASILQAYVHLGYLFMLVTLSMPFLPYFVFTDWMGCFLSSFSCGLLAPTYSMWHLHFWIGNLDG